MWSIEPDQRPDVSADTKPQTSPSNISLPIVRAEPFGLILTARFSPSLGEKPLLIDLFHVSDIFFIQSAKITVAFKQANLPSQFQ
ncbi:hypothetical protein CA13_47590 [Planctomycetes bacterium CA13]|uniref:Uncharacterized protein n=1 Tax=Novipirellula herctigrandis TaxID=2527986 RepID=A0A5C5Z7L0_9BACT|nr:hypothetical protein CA13_47590 [Planctomycetes bacterium CA13]